MSRSVSLSVSPCLSAQRRGFCSAWETSLALRMESSVDDDFRRPVFGNEIPERCFCGLTQLCLSARPLGAGVRWGGGEEETCRVQWQPIISSASLTWETRYITVSTKTDLSQQGRLRWLIRLLLESQTMLEGGVRGVDTVDRFQMYVERLDQTVTRTWAIIHLIFHPLPPGYLWAHCTKVTYHISF